MYFYGQDRISEVLEGCLYLGDYSNALCKNQLKELGIKRIVNVSNDLSCPYEDDFEYLQIKINDYPDEQLSVHLPSTYDFIHESPGPVYVHCRMGISRSPSVVIAYVGRRFNMTFDEAYEVVERKRPCIMPNHGFKMQVKEYLEGLSRR
jgi:atypical dual specificity phosphatase